MSDEIQPEEKPPRPWNACGNCKYWYPNHPDALIEKTEDKVCFHPNQTLAWTDDDMPCNVDGFMDANSTEFNVPNHCPKGTMTDPNPNAVDGRTEILIVTYAKDFDWLVLALKCIRRYIRGFYGLTIAHPDVEFDRFNTLNDQDWGIRLRLHPYHEVEGKGMLQHMVKMAEADLIVPEGTKYVLHMDADCMFRMTTTPEHYFSQDKPYYLVRTWASLGYPDHRHPVSVAVSDCAQWKGATDRQLGFDTEWYTMCMNTCVMPIGFYPRYRAHIEQVHGRPFQDFMLDGVNSFPQSNMDWTAMGAFAHRFMLDSFTWFDVENGQPYPKDRKTAFWSHGGITPLITSQIEEILTFPMEPTRYMPTPDETARMAE